MRFLTLLALTALFFSGLHASASPSPSQCKIVKMWQAGLSGKDICNEFDGSFCSSVNNVGEGMCRAADASFCMTIDTVPEGLCSALDGSFCTSVESIAEGICRGLDGSFCSTLKAEDDKLWMYKLNEACGIH